MHNGDFANKNKSNTVEQSPTLYTEKTQIKPMERLSLSKQRCDYALVVFAFFAAFPLPALAREEIVEIDMELL